jgi:hypothetical protein
MSDKKTAAAPVAALKSKVKLIKEFFLYRLLLSIN